MNLEPGTKAHEAYNKGVFYAKQGRKITECPYTTSRVVALKNWFEKGFNETVIKYG